MSAMFWTKGELRIIVSNVIGTGNSFFLYNVYSPPEVREEKKIKHFGPKRILETSSKALKATYPEVSINHAILTSKIEGKTVEPRHLFEGEAWGTPFFYEDRRYAFFVTTEEHKENIRHWVDIAVMATPTVAETIVYELPPVVMKPFPEIMDISSSITRQPGFGVIDPAPARALVTEDALISRTIGTPGTVRFGEKEIGPLGSDVHALRK
jgi:hypothetical protein